MKKILKSLRNRYYLMTDILFLIGAFVLCIPAIYPRVVYDAFAGEAALLVLLTVLIYSIVFSVSGIYRIYWIHGSAKEYLRILLASALGGLLGIVACGFLMGNSPVYLYYAFLANVIAICLIVGMRLAVRSLYKKADTPNRQNGKKVLIIGAGQLAVTVLRDIQEEPELNYNVVGLIDDDKFKKNLVVHGAKVMGNRNDIERICLEKNVDEIIFAIYAIPSADKNAILEICAETGCKVKIIPGVEAMFSGNYGLDGLRNLQIEDLLDRQPVTFETEQIASDICGKIVLVTGGGGSIGSELSRQIAQYQPKHLILLDVYENSVYELENELREKYPHLNLSVLIASIRDEGRLEEIFAAYQPEIVFHAAAHKHVPLMENSPADAVKNNIFGTLNTAKCAEKYGASRFVMISTDKAVNPTNVMGATKRVCEMIVQTMNQNSKTDFVAVRFGNVFGSNGSVIPRFKKQIEAGGPVTVTHPEITRFFMTIPEAAHLVLQAASYAEGGEIFVLDMGQPVKIYDLAKKMILLAGYEPEKDIKIEFTGLRPGEKLYEELLMNEEGLKETKHNKIFIGKPMNMTEEKLNGKLAILKEALPKGNDAVKAALREVVPTYVPPKEQ